MSASKDHRTKQHRRTRVRIDEHKARAHHQEHKTGGTKTMAAAMATSRPWGCAIDVEKFGRGITHPPVAIGIALIDHKGRIRWQTLITRKVVFSLRDGVEAPWTDPGFGIDCWTQWWSTRPELIHLLKQWSLMSRNLTVEDMAREMMDVLRRLAALPHTNIHWVSDFASYDETCLDMLVTTYGGQPAEKGIRYLTHAKTGKEFRLPLDDIDVMDWLPSRIQQKVHKWADRHFGRATHNPLDDARHHAGVWYMLQRLRSRIVVVRSRKHEKRQR